MFTSMNAYNKDLVVQIDCLTRIIQLNPLLNSIFHKAHELGIDHYYIGAGCVTQSVWNHLFELPLHHGIHDIDFVYFDSDLSYDKECEMINSVRELYNDIPFFVDVKNQARVHLWYEQHFGYPITPYASLEEAINTWPTTATAVGVRRHVDGAWRVYAPFGLNDLFGFTVRANKVQVTKEIYEKKAERWISNWPELNVIPWD